MRRKRDKLLSQDLKLWAQDYPDRKSAAKAARLVSRVVGNSKVHVRGCKVLVKTEFSADAWSMTFTTFFIMLSKVNKEHPEWLWKHANACIASARKHKTWYLTDNNNRRVSCLEFTEMWRGIIPID